jgi:probable phosphoglycerate mutase
VIVALIRHASTAWNEEARMQGRRDIPLSERGRAQARAWSVPAELASDNAAWISSPLARAVETAELLSGRSVPRESALIEMSWGEWEGCTLDELRGVHGEAYARNEARGVDFQAPGGESPRQVLGRLQPWLERIGATPLPVVAVTHLGVLRVMLAAATGWDMTGKPPLRLESDAAHRFAVDRRGRVTIDACNISLLPRPPVASRVK